MYKMCSVCSRNFDIILKFENLMLESQQFLKYMNWDHIIPPTVSDFYPLEHFEFQNIVNDEKRIQTDEPIKYFQITAMESATSFK